MLGSCCSDAFVIRDDVRSRVVVTMFLLISVLGFVVGSMKGGNSSPVSWKMASGSIMKSSSLESATGSLLVKVPSKKLKTTSSSITNDRLHNDRRAYADPLEVMKSAKRQRRTKHLIWSDKHGWHSDQISRISERLEVPHDCIDMEEGNVCPDKIRKGSIQHAVEFKRISRPGVSRLGVKHRGNGFKWAAMNARDYRRLLNGLDIQAKPDRMLQGREKPVVPVDASCDSMEVVAASNQSSSRKRKRLCYFDAELESSSENESRDRDLHGISPFKGERGSMSKEGQDDPQLDELPVEVSTHSERKSCASCLLGGELLNCVGEGCYKSYHLSCVDPPFDVAPPGVWHCIQCVKKKIELGVYSVSKVHSIWNEREVLSCQEGVRRQKEYLVKYKGLAHVHNRWIPEGTLLLEAPKLVAEFERKKQILGWKAEWTVPQRLLQKRRLSIATYKDEDPSGSADSNSDCHHEWLVKWTGLGYEKATWELENAQFLTSLEVVKLIRDYESRHETAQGSILPKADEGENTTNSARLSYGGIHGEYKQYQCYVDKLLEHCNRRRSAIAVDNQMDQERVMKVILFLLSLQNVEWGPCIVISASDALSVWEAGFSRVAPSVNFVVYNGNKDVRSCIRSLEFYNKSGQILFQVLLSSCNIVVEDIEVLKSIAWKAIIFDECQRRSKNLLKFKMLKADVRLLLVSTEIKDDSVAYTNMLSLLDFGANGVVDTVPAADSDVSKSRLEPYIAYKCEANVKFEEYWVPVQLSNVQLEQYCSKLLSNCMLLGSSLKNEPADAIRELAISSQQCCDHPFLVDQSLQKIVTEGIPVESYLDAEIQVSGKLLLLDRLLLEMKKNCFRVLITFQSICGSGSGSVGNILEDYVQQRFGKDSYVRIGVSAVYTRTKRQAAVNTFNCKESEKFVFLIENRACGRSIKLSPVDAVIIFSSDWDPRNDLKALGRITIISDAEKLKVFRLYARCTIEEKILILAKEGTVLDSSVDLVRKAGHEMLGWGVSHLFTKLENFHELKHSVPGLNLFSEWLFLDNVLHELLQELPSCSENSSMSCSFISKVLLDGDAYAGKFLLIDKDTKLPLFSWKDLLEKKNPHWFFLSMSYPRMRRKVQCVNNLTEECAFEDVSPIKKRRNAVKNQMGPKISQSRLKQQKKLAAAEKMRKMTDENVNANLVRYSPAVTNHRCLRGPNVETVGANEENTQASIDSLKMEITQLCDILKLPENFSATAVTFLEYVMRDYNVKWETVSTKQAFQISVIWSTASLLKHKIDRKESLLFAKQHRQFECEEKEAKYVCTKIWHIKKEFARCLESINIGVNSNEPKSRFSLSDQEYLKLNAAPMGFNHATSTSEHQDPVNSHDLHLSEELEDLNKGEILVNPENRVTLDQLPVTSETASSHSRFAATVEEKTDYCNGEDELNVFVEGHPEFDKSADVRKTTEEQVKPTGMHCLSCTEFWADKSGSMLNCVGGQDAISESIPSWQDHVQYGNASTLPLEVSCVPPDGIEHFTAPSVVATINIEVKAHVTTEVVVGPPCAAPKSVPSLPSQSQGVIGAVMSEGSCGDINENDICNTCMNESASGAAVKSNNLPQDSVTARKETIPPLSNDDQCQTNPNMPSEVFHVPPMMKEVCNSPIGVATKFIEVESNTVGDEATSKYPVLTCEEHGEAMISCSGLKDGALHGAPENSPAMNRLTVNAEKRPGAALTQTCVVTVDDPMETRTEDMSNFGNSTTSGVGIYQKAPAFLASGTSSSLAQLNSSILPENSPLLRQLAVSRVPAIQSSSFLPLTMVAPLADQDDQIHRRNASIEDDRVQDLMSGLNIQELRSAGLNDRPLYVDTMASDISQLACSDPLQVEKEKILKDNEQDYREHNEMITRMQFECERERLDILKQFEMLIQNLNKKYELIVESATTKLLHRMKERDSFIRILHANQLLAKAAALKLHNYKATEALGAEQDSRQLNQMMQPLVQQAVELPIPGQQQIIQMPSSTYQTAGMPILRHECLAMPPQTSGVQSLVAPNLQSHSLFNLIPSQQLHGNTRLYDTNV